MLHLIPVGTVPCQLVAIQAPAKTRRLGHQHVLSGSAGQVMREGSVGACQEHLSFVALLNAFAAAHTAMASQYGDDVLSARRH